ncbi:hypothetical protein T5B8_08348 [Salinisphaera sp. T5B8]|uniref:hypothetical protein n=1 Tax=Salinisphaera sp. T5B8 TaxID=1304154 RepID=UPI0033407283
MNTSSSINLASSGIYTIPQAALLLDVSAQRVRNWFQGYASGKSAIIDNQIGRENSKNAISFVNLMEARFIDYFVERGVRPQSIRLMLDVAREFLKVDRPFAHEAMFRTDGKAIFIEATNQAGDPKLFNLAKNSWAMHPIIIDSLHEDVTFGSDGLAKCWLPRSDIAPNVVIDPIRSFGSPILKTNKVPTKTLFSATQVEGETFDSVAHWYEVSKAEVLEAVRFEMSLVH